MCASVTFQEGAKKLTKRESDALGRGGKVATNGKKVVKMYLNGNFLLTIVVILSWQCLLKNINCVFPTQ